MKKMLTALLGIMMVGSVYAGTANKISMNMAALTLGLFSGEYQRQIGDYSLGLGYFSNGTKETDDSAFGFVDKTSTEYRMPYVFVRRYFEPEMKGFYLGAGLGMATLTVSDTYSSDVVTKEFKKTAFAFKMGYVFDVSERLNVTLDGGMQQLLSYNTSASSVNGSVTTHTVTEDSGTVPIIGLHLEYQF